MHRIANGGYLTNKNKRYIKCPIKKVGQKVGHFLVQTNGTTNVLLFIHSLLSAPYQMRLDDHRPFGHFATSVGHSGVQEAVLGDPDLFLAQHVEDGGNGAKIVVLFLEDQMHMDYFYHSVYSTFFDANILNNAYME